MISLSSVLRTSGALVLLTLLNAGSFLPPLTAQHPRDYRGIDARTFNPGRNSVPPGAYRHSGNAIYGQPGLVQQSGGFGSSATYRHGSVVAGVQRTEFGAQHLSNGFFVPSYAPVPIVGPFPVFSGPVHGMYGPVVWPGNFNGPMTLLPPLTVDPYSGQLVPFAPWCAPGLPYFGGVNSYWPGSILGPSILSLNLSMRPSVPSTAAYTMTDPRLLDILAPARAGIPLPNPIQRIAHAEPAADQDAETPLLNEFEPFPAEKQPSPLASRIHSLRHQSSGDDAFRKEDYEGAATSYRRALEFAPDRRALWIRMAFVSVTLQNYSDAARFLKTGLSMPPDATRDWLTAEELYGDRVAERARTHAAGLWNWLAERPLSSDRLLVTGAFQQFRGFSDSAHELLEMASHDGPEAQYVSALLKIAENDIGRRAISQDLERMVHDTGRDPQRSTEFRSVPESDGDELSPADADDGIVIRGSRKPNPKSDSGQPPEELQPPELTIPR